jgi:hypothetical protein
VDFNARFRAAVGYEEWEEQQAMTESRNNYYAFVSSVDFSTCKQVTPSYRMLPLALPPAVSSGRTPLCDNVLNDVCVSIPTGSEDFSFKSTRKNIYEENLFKCEDERFELDMVVGPITLAFVNHHLSLPLLLTLTLSYASLVPFQPDQQQRRRDPRARADMRTHRHAERRTARTLHARQP